MSQRDDFQTLYEENIKDNATKQITATKHREVLDYLQEYAVFLDELAPAALSFDYTRIADGSTAVSDIQFAVDDKSSPSRIYIGTDGGNQGTDLSDLFTSMAGGIVNLYNKSDYSEFLIFKVDSYNTSLGYFNGSALVNELSVGINNDYSVSFDTAPDSSSNRLNNYFVKSFSELKTAVNLCDTAGGGNIYTTGDIVFTENVAWDCTGITFYGFATNWIMLNANNESDGTLAKNIGIANGNPVFDGITFRGSQTTLASQTFSSYSSRSIFSISQSSSTIKYRNCSFNNIVGGTGSNPVIEYTTALGANTETRLFFENCFYNSANNSATFAMNGMYIELDGASTARFNLNVVNQLTAGESWGSAGTDRKFDVDSGTGNVQVKFYTDGTVIGSGDIDSTNTETLTTQAQEISSVTTGLKMPVVGTDGQAYWADIDDLKTYFNTP